MVSSRCSGAAVSGQAYLEYATAGIRVNALCPGIVHTRMLEDFLKTTGKAMEVTKAWQPMGRVGAPEDIAAAGLWLCSDTSPFVTGASIVVDGGLTAR